MQVGGTPWRVLLSDRQAFLGLLYLATLPPADKPRHETSQTATLDGTSRILMLSKDVLTWPCKAGDMPAPRSPLCSASAVSENKIKNFAGTDRHPACQQVCEAAHHGHRVGRAFSRRDTQF